jgi:hypothetical protein
MDLNGIKRHRMEGCWIKDKIQWQTVVSAVNNFWGTQKGLNFLSGSVHDKAFVPCGKWFSIYKTPSIYSIK